MGITIHFDFRFNGSGKELLSRLELIYEGIKPMDIISISKVHMDDKASDCDIGWKANKGIGFEVNVMKGSEWFTVMLFHRRVNLWTSHEFTKTQYAEDFMKCHKIVCSMLKVCEKHGILESVHDEADYWDSMDDEVLTESKEQSDGIIKLTGQRLKGAGFDAISGQDTSDRKSKPNHAVK